MRITEEKVVRLAVYSELLAECHGPQQLLQGRRLLDLSDVKDWLSAKILTEMSCVDPVDVD